MLSFLSIATLTLLLVRKNNLPRKSTHCARLGDTRYKACLEYIIKKNNS